MCVLLAALDITIITTALPTISEYFHSASGYTWIGSAYLLACSAATPTWGKISDIFGRKPIILTAIATFFLGSALCGAAKTIQMLIGGRVIQGIGGGGLITLVQICIADLFSMRSRSAYYGIIGMVWAFASGVGPILGGALVQRVSWRWCFYINLPIIGLVFFIILFFLKLNTPKTPLIAGLKAIDWFGECSLRTLKRSPVLTHPRLPCGRWRHCHVPARLGVWRRQLPLVFGDGDLLDCFRSLHSLRPLPPDRMESRLVPRHSSAPIQARLEHRRAHRLRISRLCLHIWLLLPSALLPGCARRLCTPLRSFTCCHSP